MDTMVTDSGLEHLKGLTKVESLILWDSKVTDAGLTHLVGLTNLRWLVLWETKVTDAGVKKLQQALPNCKIDTHLPTKDELQSPASPDQLR